MDEEKGSYSSNVADQEMDVGECSSEGEDEGEGDEEEELDEEMESVDEESDEEVADEEDDSVSLTSENFIGNSSPQQTLSTPTYESSFQSKRMNFKETNHFLALFLYHYEFVRRLQRDRISSLRRK